MARVERLEKVIAALRERGRKYGAGKRVIVVVGYSQGYALVVHENLNAFHRVGQAKYLEQPARERASEIGDIVREAMERGQTMERALLFGGLFLQRESQLLVPVDTGALKNSAFTRIETE
jgi:hypothetical protein